MKIKLRECLNCCEDIDENSSSDDFCSEDCERIYNDNEEDE
jgi:predicted nucleic acid-binding Zn ribbon protein